MKNYLKEVYKENVHDGFIFMLDEDEMLDISPFTYKEPGNPIEVHELGFKYHIILYKETLDGEIIEPDMFEAIIGNPYHYVANLIEIGFFGTICKKTKHSFKIVNDMFQDLTRIVKNQEKANEQTN